MRELKVMVAVDGMDGFSLCDAIELQGGIWLVPKWIESPSEGWKTPARMFLMNLLPHQKMGGDWPNEYVLSESLPKELFDGSDTSKLDIRFSVQDAPIAIQIPITKGVH